MSSPSEYAEAVLDIVARIPAGRVMSYGMIAELVRDLTGTGSARTVGTVMARYAGGEPWHRVVNSVGRLPPGKEREARERLIAEGVPLRRDHVIMAEARWFPEEAAEDGG